MNSGLFRSFITKVHNHSHSLTLPWRVHLNKNGLASQHCQAKMSSEHKLKNPNTAHPKFGHLPLSTSGPQDCALNGTALLTTAYFNKGAAFPAEERKKFGLTGLLPQNVATLDQQVKRAYQQYSSRQDDLAKNTFMTSMADQNQVLYFRVRRKIVPLF